MSDELDGYMLGHVRSFRGDDDLADSVVLVEATDHHDGMLEIAFDHPTRKERVYIRMSAADLRRELRRVTR